MCPTGKFEFKTQAEARVALARMRMSRRAGMFKEQRSYLCDKCPNWHLTSQTKRRSR